MSRFFFLLLVTSVLYAEEIEGEKFQSKHGEEFTFVSLGSSCDIASALRNYRLRKEAYPFDWILSTNGMKIIELLDNNFAFFTDERYLQPNRLSGILLHHLYNIEFSHEENSHIRFKNIKQFKEKYERRIERFKQLGNLHGKVFFIRASWFLSIHPNYNFPDEENLKISAIYALQLFDALNRFFPHLDFDLIIVNLNNDQVDIEEKILTDRIKMFSGGINSSTYETVFDQLIRGAHSK